jgi:hypothetical protein
LKMWWSEGGGGAVLALQVLKHAAATPVAAPAALQHQRARALFCSHLHAKHFRATPVPPHNCLQLQRCLCCLSQPAHKRARLVAPRYALQSQGCTRSNDPVVHVSADKVTAVDAADYGGACVAVPVGSAGSNMVGHMSHGCEHVSMEGRWNRGCSTHESSLASYCT